jgi:hypothetical protein
MTDLTPREILDAFRRALEATSCKIDRGEQTLAPRSGQLGWPSTVNEGKRASINDMTPRQILDAMQRGLEETWRKIDAAKESDLKHSTSLRSDETGTQASRDRSST